MVDSSYDVVQAERGGFRDLSGPLHWIGRAMSVSVAIFIFYTAFFGGLEGVPHRAIVLAFLVPLVFLYVPASKKEASNKIHITDITAIFISLGIFIYISIDYYVRLKYRVWYIEPLSAQDMILGIFSIIIILEATRRTFGLFLPILTLSFILYMYFGPYFPGILGHAGIPISQLVEHLFLTHEGIFNYITGILATFLFTFVAFGAFLRCCGADRLFLDFAVALAGHRTGGPAKVAVLASAILGSVTGSNIANVITTGSITIPLMKKVGYPAYRAAAIEAVASTGGQVLPPVMGVGIFILIEFTGIPLGTVLLYSVLPGLMFFISVYAYVHVSAVKMGLTGMDRGNVPSVGESARRIAHLVIPLILLVYLLLDGFTPFFASAACVAVTVPVSWLHRDTRITFRRLVWALEESTRSILSLTGIMVTAAIIVGAITQTGFMVKMTSLLVWMAGDSLFILFLLITVVSYVLGMAVPTVTAYVLVATVASPALQELGVPLLAAHLLIFWLSQDSAITPPMCQTAFVAASIAKAPLMRTGFESIKVGKVIYYVPFLFAFSQLITGTLFDIAVDFVLGTTCLVIMQAVFEGFWLTRLRPWEWIALVVAACVLTYAAMLPTSESVGYAAGGGILVVATLLAQKRSLALASRHSRQSE